LSPPASQAVQTACGGALLAVAGESGHVAVLDCRAALVPGGGGASSGSGSGSGWPHAVYGAPAGRGVVLDWEAHQNIVHDVLWAKVRTCMNNCAPCVRSDVLHRVGANRSSL
jgi:hypothetical protein